ncbi:hypothetical protein WJX77_004214 [Trebouxia sp. C0004]
MTSKISSRYCIDHSPRGLKLAVLWLLLTVLGVGYARRRGITLTLLPNTRQPSAQCAASDASARLLKYQDISTTLSQKRVRARAHGTDALRMLDQGLLFAWSYNQPEARKSFALGLEFDSNEPLLHWAYAYILGPFQNKVPHAKDPGYPAFLPLDYKEASEAASTALQLATLQASSLDAPTEQEDAELALALAEASSLLYDPHLLDLGPDQFVRMFNEAERRWAETMERIARQQHSADLLAMAAEALMIPEAWNLKQAGGGGQLKPAGVRAEQLILEALEWDPFQPLALHLHVHIAETGSPVRGQGYLQAASGEKSADMLHSGNGTFRHMGHLLHMPAHVFVRLGRYHDAVEAGLRALAVDAQDVADCQTTVASEHDMDLLVYSANMAGQSHLAIEWSKKLQQAAELYPRGSWLGTHDTPSFDWTTLPLTWVFHGMWESILENLTPPPANARGICAKGGYEYAVSVYHYAMALAHAAQSETLQYHQNNSRSETAFDRASWHLQQLQVAVVEVKQEPPTEPGEGAGLYSCEHHQLSAIQVHVAKARIAQAEGPYPGNLHAAEHHLKEAVLLEDQLSYAAPPRQAPTLRHCLTHILERTESPAEAEVISRQALSLYPNNPWGLYALLESLKKQDRGAAEVQQLKPSLIPRAAAVAKQPSPKEKTEGKGSLYAASGTGLRLCAPKTPASFVVDSTSTQAFERRKLKPSDLKVTIKGNVTVKADIKQLQDGTLEVCYTAPLTGEYRISLSVGSTAVPGSPFRMACQQPRACENNTQITENSANGFANERYAVKLACHDQFGSPYTGKADVHADVLDGATVLFSADVLDLGGGRYEVAFMPEISGVYSLSICLDGHRPLKGCPLPVRVRNDETCAVNCKLYGLGLTQGTAGQPIEFSIQACDAKNNARSLGGDAFSISLSGPALQDPVAYIKDNLDGTYTVSWRSETAGTYLVEAQFEGIALAGCPASCQVLPGDLAPSRCTCTGEGLAHATAGQLASFRIHTLDGFGNSRTPGGDAFEVSAQCTEEGSQPEAVAGRVEDLGQGMYRAMYTATMAGSCEIAVTALDGAHVQGSPFQCLVSPGEADAGSSRLYGPGLQAIQLGKPSCLFLQLVDQWGNPATAVDLASAAIKVTIDGPQPTPVQAGVVRAGVWAFTYHAHAAGTYTVTASIHGVHVRNSPAVVVASIAEACPSQCEVKGTPLTLSTAAGQQTQFMIIARDAQGTQKSLGGDTFAVSWCHTATGACTTGKVEDLDSGEYRAYFTATVAGSYAVSAMLKGCNIAGSPFAAAVTAVEVDAGCSYAAGDGVTAACSGHLARIVVKPQDRFSNPVSSPCTDPAQAGFQVELAGPASPLDASWDVASGSHGELAATYLPVLTGTCSIAVKYQGQHVQGSPYQVVIEPNQGQAQQSSMTGRQPYLIAGVPQQLAVTARDAQGNLTAGTDKVQVMLDSTAEGLLDIPVSQHSPGQYTAEICCKLAGMATVKAKLNGKTVGQPITLPIKASAASQLSLAGKGSLYCTAGSRHESLFSCVDSFGNAVKQGGAALRGQCTSLVFDKQLTESQQCEVAHQGNGMHALSYCLCSAGPYEVRAWLEEQEESVVTVQGQCSPAATCVHQCRIEAPSELVAGCRGEVTIWQYDQYGNQVTRRAAHGQFIANAQGPGAMKTQLVLGDAGKVMLQVMASVAGVYTLSVANSQAEAVRGCPLEVTVVPNVISAAHSSVKLAHSSVVAGSQADLLLTARDVFGNKIQSMEADVFKASIEGPQSLTFGHHHSNEAYSAHIERAGSYLVHAHLGGSQIFDCPKLLQVLPGASAADRCQLKGSGQQTTVAAVEDLRNGAYNITFTPDVAGRWTVLPRLNGQLLHETGFEMHASYGPVAVEDCVLKPMQAINKVIVNSSSCFELSTANAGTTGRVFDGTEDVIAFVTGPSMLRHVANCFLAEDRSHYRVESYWGCQLGSVQLHVHMGGKAVPNSPVTVDLQPGPVCLNRTDVHGATSPCTAGEEQRLVITATDADRHLTDTDSSANFTVQISSNSQCIDAVAKAFGKHTHTACFTLTEAGPFTVTMRVEGSQGCREYKNICKPGPVSVPHCKVLSIDSCLTAGQAGQLRLQRRDMYGNEAAAPAAGLVLAKLLSSAGQLLDAVPAVYDMLEETVIHFTPTQAGAVKLWVGSTTEEAVPGAPFLIQVHAAVADPSKCQASFLHFCKESAVLTAGSRLYIHLNPMDAFNNPAQNTLPVVAQILGGPALCQLSAKEARQQLRAGSQLHESAAANPHGLVFVAEAQRAGAMMVDVTVGGQAVANQWPKPLLVLPGKACAAHSFLSNHCEKATCGQNVSAVLHIVDAFGNAALTGGADVSAQLQTPDGTMMSEVQVVDNQDGTYNLMYSLSEGDHTLHPQVDGTPLRRHGFPVMAAFGSLQAQDVVASLQDQDEGHVCGGVCNVHVKAPGRSLSGLEAWMVRTSSSQSTTNNADCHSVKADTDATDSLKSSWTWTHMGQHEVSVLLAGRHVQGSPLLVNVQAAQLCPQSCQLLGMTHAPSSGALSLTITGRDAYGNPCRLEPGNVQVTCQPEGALQHVQIQQADTAHDLVLSASALAQGTLFVAVQQQQINPLGWPILLQPTACTNLAFVGQDKADVEPLQVIAGELCSALLETQDALGQRIRQEGASITATLSSTITLKELAANVRHVGHGVYEVSATLKAAGTYTLAIRLECGHTAGVAPGQLPPLEAQVVCMPAAVAAECCRVELQTEPWVAGQTVSVHVHRHDRFGNCVEDSDAALSFTAEAEGPGPVDAAVDSTQAGPARLQLLARQSGAYSLMLVSASQEALGSVPIQAHVVAAPACPDTSTWVMQGIGSHSKGRHQHTLQAGQPVHIEVDLRDAYGNLADVGNAALTATASGPHGQTPLDLIPSPLSFSAPLTAAGTYSLAVAFTDAYTQQTHVLSAQNQIDEVRVVAGPVCAQRTMVQGLHEKLVAGAGSEFRICPVDTHGNAGASGGNFAVEAKLGDSIIPGRITESLQGPRSVTAHLLLQQAGRWNAAVSFHSRSPEGADVSTVIASRVVEVEEGVASASSCRLLGFWPVQRAIADVPAGFIIQARDSFGNLCQSGGDSFSVQIQGVARENICVTDRHDATYAVEYCVPAEGSYQASVTLDGAHVAGSPAPITAFRDIGMLADQEIEHRLASSVSGLRRGIASARTLHASLRSEAKSLEDFIPMLVEGARSGITSLLKHQEVALAENKAAYAREALERRRLHNVVQELRGNIRVYVRVKPLSAEEVAVGHTSVLKCQDGHRLQCTALGSVKAFDFDRVFGPEVQQAGVFEDVSQLVTSALDGYNVCIFAYGQTGAGKTHTMEGSKQDPGINYRAMKELFRSIEEERTDARYAISVSIVEIYNEMVHDLLAEEGKADPDLQKGPAGFTIPDLTRSDVTSPEQIFEIMEKGFEHRAVGCHDINARSSRSHCLLVINVAATDAASGVRTVGKLTLCDLAGSERITKTGATGLTLTEAQNINKSLLELGNVISALMQQSKHVPYRNSKLTMLLQDSLGGDAKALMFCNLASTAIHATETLSSLGFASKVSNVVLKTPQRKFQDVKENIPSGRQMSRR